MSRYQSWKALQLRENRKNQKAKRLVVNDKQYSDYSIGKMSKCHLDCSEAKRRELFLNRFLHFAPTSVFRQKDEGASVEMTGDFSTKHTQILKRVAEIYNWLDREIRSNADLAGQCNACGKCCNFENPAGTSEHGFDHRLFVTTPEMIYLTMNLGAEKIKPMVTSRGSTLSTWFDFAHHKSLKTGTLTIRCPYNIDGKCTIYEYRFAGCRIFCCKADTDFQSRLSESVLKKFKSICTELGVPYRYIYLAGALNGTFD